LHDRLTVDVGIEKLIDQMHLLVPEMVDGKNAVRDGASSESSKDADAGAWGDDLFSYHETREELERLKLDEWGSAMRGSAEATEDESLLYSLPALVVKVPNGVLVTAAMEAVRDAVLSDTTPAQIGFCGMGGIGKTTVSSWAVRETSIRSKFKMLAWISFGQTPNIENCASLLHLQLTGYEMEKDLSSEQQDERLKQVFVNKSILLVLDDCWDQEVVKKFNWIDDTNTNSKILISSRIRDVLDGGLIVDLTLPSADDAINMLINVAGISEGENFPRNEAGLVVDICKRLPLTIGIAGKLIKQMALTDEDSWIGLVDLLKDELATAAGESVEESVIRASVKSIPIGIRAQVFQLFTGFALIPEDVVVPLAVMGMIYDACSASDAVPLSRLQTRQYLKVLIDRSLVMGTVDRPQLHDIVWYGARFPTDICTRGCHWIPRMFA
jgi:hypothetical protein